MRLKLQFFAGDGEGGNSDPNTGNQSQNTQQSAQQSQQSGIDYDKIQSMLDTATAKKENAVLKSYFQQQGLSEEEVTQAIATYKTTKEQQSQAQQNNNVELQNQVNAANLEAEQAKIELEATKIAMSLGIDAKNLPYILKMADMSNVKGSDGKISQDNIKSAINKVLEDVPALKTEKQNNAGFQIGAGNQNQSTQQTNTQTVPQKRWNRWNN